MADGQQRRPNFPEPVRYALSDFKNRLHGRERLTGGLKPPSIGFRVQKAGVLINGKTNVQGDKMDGNIDVILPIVDAMALPDLLDRATRMAPGTHEGLVIAQSDYDRQKEIWKDPRHRGTILVGRGDDGIIFISLSSWDRQRPVIHIPLASNELVKQTDGTDQPIAESVASERAARWWAQALRHMLPLAYSTQYGLSSPPGGAGGGNRGGSSQGGGGGNYNRNASGSQGSAAAPAVASGGSSYRQDDYEELP